MPSGDLEDTASEPEQQVAPAVEEVGVLEVTATPRELDPFWDELATLGEKTSVAVTIPDPIIKVVEKLRSGDSRRYDRIRKALSDLHVHGPSLGKFRSKKLQQEADMPKDLYQSRLENARSAWRVWWFWTENSTIEVWRIGAHG